MKEKLLIIFVCLTAILTLPACGGYDTTLFSQIIADSGVMECNVCLVKKTVDGNSSSYSKGASGVIYNYENSTYYLLTAYHVVKDLDEDDCLYILLFDDAGYTGGGLSLYYDTLPTGTVEYGAEERVPVVADTAVSVGVHISNRNHNNHHNSNQAQSADEVRI